VQPQQRGGVVDDRQQRRLLRPVVQRTPQLHRVFIERRGEPTKRHHALQ
jgi:hypothetical protein